MFLQRSPGQVCIASPNPLLKTVSPKNFRIRHWLLYNNRWIIYVLHNNWLIIYTTNNFEVETRQNNKQKNIRHWRNILVSFSLWRTFCRLFMMIYLWLNYVFLKLKISNLFGKINEIVFVEHVWIKRPTMN